MRDFCQIRIEVEVELNAKLLTRFSITREKTTQRNSKVSGWQLPVETASFIMLQPIITLEGTNNSAGSSTAGNTVENIVV